VNVDQKQLNNITIAFLEEDSWAQNNDTVPNRLQAQPETRRHKRLETDDFLVSPGDTVELTKVFMIEGIPEEYLNQQSFLTDMQVKVFEEVPLEGISIPPKQADGTLAKNSLEIRFKVPLNIQRLPKIAMKLKKFLKRKNIPPLVVNGVTLQVRHEEPEPKFLALEENPVIGLIFKGIPRSILESNESLYAMESDVFTGNHPIRLMEPIEADLMLRITIEKPINNQKDITNIAIRLKRFLAKQSISQQVINDVLVMSFNQEKWQRDMLPENQAVSGSTDYVGIEIENIPVFIIDHIKHLEAIKQQVFADQEVVHMDVCVNTLRVTFGVVADSAAIEKVARALKRFLSSMKVPIKQINEIIIAPHTAETWRKTKQVHETVTTNAKT